MKKIFKISALLIPTFIIGVFIGLSIDIPKKHQPAEPLTPTEPATHKAPTQSPPKQPPIKKDLPPPPVRVRAKEKNIDSVKQTQTKPSIEKVNPKIEREKMIEVSTYQIQAFDLASAYKANEFAADAKYKNKIVIVGGDISEFDESFGILSIQLETDIPFTSIYCQMHESEKPLLAQLGKGGYVGVVGKVTGKSLGMVQLENCYIKIPRMGF